MMIDPGSHLFLHRQRQHARDLHLGHLAAARATRDTTGVVVATRSADSSLWQRLLRADRSAPKAPALR